MKKMLATVGLSLLLGLSSSSVWADEFVFKDIQGKIQKLSDYQGKWVLVNFWATWCPPCLREIPDLMILHEAHHKKDLVVIGIAMSSTEKAVHDFVKQKKINYPIVISEYREALQIGEVDVFPTSYLYDPTGKLVSYQEGEISRQSVETYIARKLAQQNN